MNDSNKPLKPGVPPDASPKPPSKVSPEVRARFLEESARERANFVKRLNAHAEASEPPEKKPR